MLTVGLHLLTFLFNREVVSSLFEHTQLLIYTAISVILLVVASSVCAYCITKRAIKDWVIVVVGVSLAALFSHVLLVLLGSNPVLSVVLEEWPFLMIMAIIFAPSD